MSPELKRCTTQTSGGTPWWSIKWWSTTRLLRIVACWQNARQMYASLMRLQSYWHLSNVHKLGGSWCNGIWDQSEQSQNNALRTHWHLLPVLLRLQERIFSLDIIVPGFASTNNTGIKSQQACGLQLSGSVGNGFAGCGSGSKHWSNGYHNDLKRSQIGIFIVHRG